MNCLAPICTECLSKTFGPLETILNWKRGNGEKRTNSDLSICNEHEHSCEQVLYTDNLTQLALKKKGIVARGNVFMVKKGQLANERYTILSKVEKNRGNSEKRTSSDASLQFCQFMCNSCESE